LLTLSWLCLSLAACSGRDQGGGGGGTGGSAGGGSGTGGGSSTGGGTGTGGGAMDSGMCPVITVNQAVNNLTQYSGGCVEIDNAVVIAASTPFVSTGSGCIGNMEVETFYIQDSTGGAGLGVYKSCKDDVTALPNVGDVVNLAGRLSKFDSSLQISSSSKYMIIETITVTGPDAGHTTGGAYAPAGVPIEIDADAGFEYAHDVAGMNPHPEQIGQALHFSNVTVTDRYPPGFIVSKADGGTPTTNGFQLNNGVWVDDSIVYYDCIKPLAADAGIPLPNGIRGVWDRYNDFYGETGNADSGFMPAPTYPVLIPMTCADLQ
jgi:hypothetical protein